MKKILLLSFCLISFIGFSQEDAWIYFTNKPNSETYLSNPLSMLTQRALDRRSAQGIALNINDVPVHQPYIDQISATSGIIVKAKSKWMNCLHIRGTIADINSLLILPFVDHITFANPTLNPSGRFANKKSIKEPKLINKQMNVDVNFNYGTSANQIQMLNGHLLHQANYTGTGKIIAVLDSGFLNVNSTAPFQRLFDNNLILGGYNYVSQNTNVYSLHNHGTMVLSCMGGFVDNQLVGTAPDAKYYLFVTEDVTSENPVEESFWVEAAEEADRLGVDIITTSLGYFGYDNPNYSHSYSDLTGNAAFISKGANIAFSKGIIVVASAGNSGATANPYISVPAEATNVLAIGAVQANGSYAGFSSIGPTFDGRVKPDVMAQGQASVLANTSGTVMTASGTSFSCPIMAGVIACLWQALPNLTNQQIVTLIKESGDKFTTPNAQYGYGIPNFQSALTAGLLSVNELLNNEVVLFPNPFKNNIQVALSNDNESFTIEICNALGQNVVTKQKVSSFEIIPMEHLNSGVYFYSIQGKNSSKSGKIIKQ